MENNSKSKNKISPDLRQRLLNETNKPFRGPRRLLWLALFGSAFIGLFIMGLKSLSGDMLNTNDYYIQISAVIIFAFVLWFDREKK